MNLTDPNLQNNLHYKPLSAHLGRGVVWAATLMQKNASETAWHGRVVTVLSKAMLVAAAILSIPLVLIETVVSLALAGIGIAINKLFYQNHNEFLQKHTLKILSFSVHSLAVTVALGVLGYKSCKGFNLSHHTPRALADHGLHLASAAFVQLTYGASLDRDAGRDETLAVLRSFNLLRDSHPDVMNDLIAQVERDISGLNLRGIQNRIANAPELQAYFNEHQEDRQFVQNLEMSRLINDRAYREQGVAIVRRMLTEMHIARLVEEPPAAGEAPLAAGNRRIELSQNTPEESAYQDYLAQKLKTSFRQIHGDQTAWQHLSRNGTNGNELLELMDASTYMPLLAATSLMEIDDGEIHCPAQFTTENLVQYNERRAKIQEAKNLIHRFNDEQGRALVRKILRGADEQAEGVIQEAFLKVSELAAALNQGPLMTKTFLNLDAIDNGGSLIETRNLFQTVCQEAVAEIEARRNQQQPDPHPEEIVGGGAPPQGHQGARIEVIV